MLPGTAPSDPPVQEEKDKDERRKIIIALLFLLLSFSCIFCSSQGALWLINRDRVDASMRSKLKADYGFDPALALAPLSEEIIAEAEQDEAALLARHTPIAVGLGIAILPNPLPTPAPTAITLLPTPTPTPTPTAPGNPDPAPATPAAPTVTQEAPPTSPPSTSTSAPPPTVPPTVPATALPTVPPTVLPTIPATVPPTVVPTIPATVPPTVAPTVPPTAVPATATATSTTPADTPTATATPTATDTPTETPTPTPTDTPTATPTNTPIPPAVQFDLNDYPAGEGDGSVSILVTLSGTSATTITVEYTTSNLTAEEGSDYTATSGILTFPPGSTSQTFPITINDDSLDEPNETVRLTLNNPNGATMGTPNTATLTIIDNDSPGTCAGIYPADEPNIGSPNGVFARIACNVGVIFDLGSDPVNRSGDGNFDLVYYEVQGNTPPPSPNPLQIYMDWIVVEVGQTPSGPWFQVFYWGNPTLDANTNIGQAGYGPPENDNLLIPMSILYGPAPFNTGIAIDVDAPLTAAGAPPGPYPYVRIFSPTGGDSDGPEIDAIEAIP